MEKLTFTINGVFKNQITGLGDYIMINITGSKKELALKLREELQISFKDAIKIISYLQLHNEYLSDDEYIKLQSEIKNDDNDGLNLVLESDNEYYYFNIKKITIILAATLLDINLTSGFANAALALSGMPTKSIFKLKNANLCVVKEIKMNHRTFMDISRICNQECINNDIPCCYRIGGCCTLDEEKLKSKIISSLLEDGILTEKNGSYFYQF